MQRQSGTGIFGCNGFLGEPLMASEENMENIIVVLCPVCCSILVYCSNWLSLGSETFRETSHSENMQ